MTFDENEDNAFDINDLLIKYRSLRSGKEKYFLEEEAYMFLFDYYIERNQIPKALEACDIGLDNFPLSTELMLKKADLLIELNKPDEALALIDRVEVYDSTNANLFIVKTDALFALHQNDEARALLPIIYKKFNTEELAELLLELADVYDDHSQFVDVFYILKKVLSIEPTNEEALYKICFWADYNKLNEESIEVHQAIIEEHPYCELAWFNLASAFQSLKLYERAIDAYAYVLVIDEKFDFAYRNTADAYIKLKKYKEAIEHLKKVLEIGPGEDIIYEAIGYCYEKLKRASEARYYYKKALHLNPSNANIYSKIATTYTMQQQWASAVKILDSALAIARLHPEFNYTKAVCHFQLDEMDKALEHIAITLKKRPKKTKAWELIFAIFYCTEEYEKGIETVEFALIETLSKKPIFYYYMALFYFGLRKTKMGILYLEQALHSNPQNFFILTELEPAIMMHPAIIKCVNNYNNKK